MQLRAIVLEKSKRLDPANPWFQIAERITHQRMKTGAVWGKIFGDTHPSHQPKLFPVWLGSGGHFIETSGNKSNYVEADKKWVSQRLEKGWKTYDLALYTDGSATSGTEMGCGGDRGAKVNRKAEMHLEKRD